MMEEEEEDTLFDQEGLLGRKEEAAHEKIEWKRKLVKTAALSMSFFCLGLCIAIPGPTLLDLGKRVNHDTEYMTFIFTARSLGYLFGALAGGIVFDFFNQQLLLFYTMCAAAVATASVPWCTSLFVLSAFISVQGIALGVLDTGGNVHCIRIWGQKSAPFMQVLHFAFGIGAFLAPLVAQPFLMDSTVVFENMTRSGYYPVNFKVPSFGSYSRNVRDLSHVELWGKNYTAELEEMDNTLNMRPFQLKYDVLFSTDNIHSILSGDAASNTALKQSRESFHEVDKDQSRAQTNYKSLNRKLLDEKTNLVNYVRTDTSFATTNSQKKEENLIFLRAKRQLTNVPSNENNTSTGNTTQMFDDDVGKNVTTTLTYVEKNVTTTLTYPITTPRPVKPAYNNGEDLSVKNADATEIEDQLKDLKKNPPVQNINSPQEMLTVGASTTPVDIPLTTVANTSQSLNDTDVSSHNINDTQSTNETTSLPSYAYTTTATTTLNTTIVVSTTSNVVPTTIATAATSESTSTTTTTEFVSQPSEVVHDISTTNPTTDKMLVTNSEDGVSSTTNSSTEKKLITKSEDDQIVTSNSNTSNINTSSMNASNLNTFETEEDLFSDIITAVTGMSKIQLAYLLIALFLVINAAIYLFLYCKERMLTSSSVVRTHEDMIRPLDTKCFVTSLALLLFFFFFAYMGMEVTFGGLLTTFAVYYPDHNWTPAQAAALTAVFWGCLALGRCFAIFIARCFKPPCMMVINLCLTFLGAMLLSFTVTVSPVMLWIGTITLGLGMSSLFPTTISWANSYYPLTGRATAVFVAGSGIGEMVIPVATGYLYESVNRMSLMYITLGLSATMSVIYLSLQLLVCQKGKAGSRRSHSGFMRLNNSEDMADAVDMDTIDFAEGGTTTGITEMTSRRRVHNEEEERLKQNGDSCITTELTKLVELSD